MKFTTTALALLPAALAAPTTTSGFAVPSVLKMHDIQTNANWPNTYTNTVRSGTYETSTLYDIPIPASAQGRTCALSFKASGSDYVEGAQALDIFKGSFTDLASLNSGNLRDQQLARIVFNPATGLYEFKRSDFTPTIDSFPCPAGKVLHWEAAAVGEFDVNIVAQDFAFDGVNVPNGISVKWW
ncbi:hypothetical protein F5Y08DRAFT_219236 [Xylaria arbuscula]|uniref:Ubiquitin 3 binding protein But2 C-terminal domain-containing protein n=1 Tax=Xylaria arbuscula TaxID=114810 RepID=A0A9W8TLZ0_9PEZI|nr:hypothetical protein F5Y08DRAFT_219236 [Xylaria arbuscula]KAJ3574291.1 hypothetical protein NPX13_g4412 [Xylaria arbuscula]